MITRSSSQAPDNQIDNQILNSKQRTGRIIMGGGSSVLHDATMPPNEITKDQISSWLKDLQKENEDKKVFVDKVKKALDLHCNSYALESMESELSRYIQSKLKDYREHKDEDDEFDFRGDMTKRRDIFLVNLAFIKDFISSHPQIISESLTIEQVVTKIILPETADEKDSYVKSKLRKNHLTNFYHQLRDGNSSNHFSYPLNNLSFIPLDWSLPFSSLAEMVNTHPKTYFKRKIIYEKNLEAAEIDYHTYYYLDIFCENLHYSPLTIIDDPIAKNKEIQKYFAHRYEVIQKTDYFILPVILLSSSPQQNIEKNEEKEKENQVNEFYFTKELIFDLACFLLDSPKAEHLLLHYIPTSSSSTSNDSNREQQESLEYENQKNFLKKLNLYEENLFQSVVHLLPQSLLQRNQDFLATKLSQQLLLHLPEFSLDSFPSATKNIHPMSSFYQLENIQQIIIEHHQKGVLIRKDHHILFPKDHPKRTLEKIYEKLQCKFIESFYTFYFHSLTSLIELTLMKFRIDFKSSQRKEDSKELSHYLEENYGFLPIVTSNCLHANYMMYYDASLLSESLTMEFISLIEHKFSFQDALDDEAFHSAGPYGVSLEFLHDFLLSHPEIARDQMTTAEVVEKIIKPETMETKETYVKAKLWKQKPHYFIDLRRKQREIEFIFRHRYKPEQEFVYDKLESGSRPLIDEYFYGFFSHAWLMPFTKLVEIAYEGPAYRLSRINELPPLEVINDRVYLWIDVFCKNQHIPAPAMNEFHQAIEAPGFVVAAMWPTKPFALSRIWCLFELWTAIHKKIGLIPSFPAMNYQELVAQGNIKQRIASERFHLDNILVNAKHAQATFHSDASMILSLIAESIGLEEFNQTVYDAILSSLHHRYELSNQLQSNECFTANGLVLMANHSYKKVKDLQIGDEILTHEGTMATIQLIIKNLLKSSAEGKKFVEMCEIGNLWITPEHPIYWEGKWILPKNMTKIVETDQFDVLYNVELSAGGNSLVLNGIPVVTLGNNLNLPLDELYGSGWKTNPKRQFYLQQQQQQQQLQMLSESSSSDASSNNTAISDH